MSRLLDDAAPRGPAHRVEIVGLDLVDHFAVAADPPATACSSPTSTPGPNYTGQHAVDSFYRATSGGG